jgi:membrane protease YdiL (CAAX protease family)
MAHDNCNPSASTPVGDRSHDSPEQLPPSSLQTVSPAPEGLPVLPLPPRLNALVPEDLRAPWGWSDVGLFLIFIVIGSLVTTWGLVFLAVRLFGGNISDFTGPSMSTSKSVLLLLSQGLLDAGAIVYLFVMLRARTPAPFWRTIGWHDLHLDGRTFHASAIRCLGGGAVLAMGVSFVGGFLNSKESLPIEELLQARISVVLFAVLGVLVAPLVEETIFRGFLYPVIARRWGIAAGILITGTLFGLLHAAQLWGGWGQIALLIFVGLLLTWVRARTGTVTASYFVHLGYNGLQLLGYLAYTMSKLRH